jgi:tRNA-dihydrouridine synthase C
LIIKGTPAVVLAPMEGVTDAPMRCFMGQYGAFNHAVTEFIRISNSVPHIKTLKKLVPEYGLAPNPGPSVCDGSNYLHPVQIQFLGGNEERLAAAANNAVAAGASSIDLNFGCPAPTVNKNDGGATLLQHPMRIESIVSAVRRSIPANVHLSAKIRLGWADPKEVRTIATKAAEGGISWLTIHARTKRDGYRPPAHWHYISDVVRDLYPLPVIANGDIWTEADMLHCQEITKCEHFMLGRSALADPFLSHRLAKLLGLKHFTNTDHLPVATAHSAEFSREIAICFTNYCKILSHFGYSQKAQLTRLKQWATMIYNRWPQSWITDFRKSDSLSQALRLLNVELGNVNHVDPVIYSLGSMDELMASHARHTI